MNNKVYLDESKFHQNILDSLSCISAKCCCHLSIVRNSLNQVSIACLLSKSRLNLLKYMYIILDGLSIWTEQKISDFYVCYIATLSDEFVPVLVGSKTKYLI